MATEWEERFAYSRIQVRGPLAKTAGTIAVENGAVFAPSNMYVQSHFIFNHLEKVLSDKGFELDSVIATKAYVTDISKAEELGRAHAEFFKGIDPVMTMVQVNALILEEAMVEIELTAWKET